MEEHGSLIEGDLLAGRDELRQLLVAQRVEQEDRAEVLDVHQVVSR